MEFKIDSIKVITVIALSILMSICGIRYKDVNGTHSKNTQYALWSLENNDTIFPINEVKTMKI